jgi:RHS repeat-associated protein
MAACAGYVSGEQETDYYPYGGEYPPFCSTISDQKFKFTGKERDSESGLDNFDFRYYSSSLGRFMKPDDSLVYWDRSDPQSLNLYSYVENNPVSNTDPDGHDCVYLNNAGNGVESIDQSSSSGECGNTGGYWVNGAVTNAQIDQNSVTLTGTTNGVDNNTSASYLTNGDVPISPQAAQTLSLAGQMAAPGVNLAAKGLMAFGWMYSAPAMLLATCASGGPGCNGPNMAMAVLPEVAALREGGVLIREGAAFGKGAELIGKAGGVAQATKDFEALQGTEAVYGSTRVKTLSDGSKAVLYQSTGGSGATTLAIQNAAGRTITKYRY